MRGFLPWLCLALGATPAAADSMLLGDARRGQALHDRACTRCHVSMVGGDGSAIYTRENRRIRSVEGLEARVAGCSRNTGAGFSPEQVQDVVKYLNDGFYKFQ